MDPGFEMGGGGGGGAPNAHVSMQKKFTMPHSLLSPQPGLGTMDITWNRDTIIAIGIN